MSLWKNQKNFPYPDCWKDDERMDVLFSPFRPRNVNPENYDAKLNFWKTMIKDYCEYQGCCAFSKTEISNGFRRNQKIPYGLQTVIDHMLQNGEIRLESEFRKDPLNSWSHWAVNNIVKKPLNWGVNFLSGSTADELDASYIHLESLKKQVDEVQVWLQMFSGQVVSLKQLLEVENLPLSKDGMFLCLLYLHHLKKIYMGNDRKNSDKILIKIPNLHEPSKPLNDVDYALYNLLATKNKILKNIDDLEAEIQANDEKLKTCIREGKRATAKNYLRKKHLLESRLEKKHTYLDNLESLTAQVQESETQTEMLDAYKMGSKTLSNILADNNMNLSNVDETMANVKESLELHDEIQQTLGASVTDSAEEAALEEELNEILSLEKQQEEEREPTKVNEKEKEKQDNIEKDLLARLEKLRVQNTSLDESHSEKQTKLA